MEKVAFIDRVFLFFVKIFCYILSLFILTYATRDIIAAFSIENYRIVFKMLIFIIIWLWFSPFIFKKIKGYYHIKHFTVIYIITVFCLYLFAVVAFYTEASLPIKETIREQLEKCLFDKLMNDKDSWELSGRELEFYSDYLWNECLNEISAYEN